jgi:glutamate-1-semialdehyde-2,1-aminomutase
MASKRLRLKKSEKLYEEAKRYIPGGITGIRRPINFIPGEYPIFLKSGKGGRITDVDGNEFVDLLLSYGPIIIGHREKVIDDAVVRQMKNGFCFNLPQVYQNELCKMMSELIPCAEQTILVRTGSDATTGAIRIARGYTNKTKIIRSGYHGWHDWCVEVKGGILPKAYEDTIDIHYNDVETLVSLFKQYPDDIAAVIVTGIGHPLNEPVVEPTKEFFNTIRELTTKHGSVMILDEIRTGFRVSLGGAQKRYGVTPDLATFGKAMANGYCISAISGKREVMNVVTEGKVFISSTFFHNSLEMVASIETIKFLRKNRVIENIWKKGEYLLNEFRRLIEPYQDIINLSGIPPMPFFTFPRDSEGKYKERRKAFYTECIRAGVFMQPYHHSYICYRHTEKDLNQVLNAVEGALKVIKEI